MSRSAIEGKNRMAAQAAKVICLGTAKRELLGGLRCVARQPILDLQGRVHGYDLIFRNTPDSVFRRDAGLAVETMLDNQVIFGLERLTNGLPAFITCTAEALIEGRSEERRVGQECRS